MSQSVFVSVVKVCCVDSETLKTFITSVCEKRNSALSQCAFLKRLSVLGFVCQSRQTCSAYNKSTTLRDIIKKYKGQILYILYRLFLKEKESVNFTYITKGFNSHSHIIDNRNSVSMFLLSSDILEIQLNCVNRVDEVGCSFGAVCYS